MPDHFHVLITLERDMSVERAVQFIKGGFAFRACREFGFRPPVWQRGFSEVRVNDARAFAQTRHYIRDNPVEAHLVNAPEEYLYSSAYPGFILDPAPQGLTPGGVCDSFGMAKAMP